MYYYPTKFSLRWIRGVAALVLSAIGLYCSLSSLFFESVNLRGPEGGDISQRL